MTVLKNVKYLIRHLEVLPHIRRSIKMIRPLIVGSFVRLSRLIKGLKKFRPTKFQLSSLLYPPLYDCYAMHIMFM